MECLLTNGCDPNAFSKRGVSPISVAAQLGSFSIAQILLDMGADVDIMNKSGSTALIQVNVRFSYKSFKLTILIQFLLKASHYGFLEIVLLLIRSGCTPDLVNFKGTTALMRAAQEGHVDIVTVLILAGCSVSRQNAEGMNALMLASLKGYVDVVTELLRAGCRIDDQTTMVSNDSSVQLAGVT